MKNIKIKLFDIFIVLLFAIATYSWFDVLTENEHIANNPVYNVFNDNISIKVYFCPRDNCEKKLNEMIKKSEYIDCAFYDLNLQKTISLLENKKSRLIIDQDYEHRINETSLTYITDGSSRYMHNKFCIFDNKTVFSGSMNPTHNDAKINNNNIIFIESKKIASNYANKFRRMYELNEFKNRNAESIEFRQISDTNENITITTLFCPEDDCEKNVIKFLEKSNKSIYFMTFSFTSVPIGNLLVSLNESIEIKGIFENWLNSNSQWSRYSLLKEMNEPNFILSKPPAKLHHKVFIIDEKIVITGSYNPSNNANVNNDENILIIENKKISEKYLFEFRELWEKYE